MKRRNVTVTSKNQITLPADLVRKYKLDENRVMEVRERNGVLELRPQPSLEDVMRKHWDHFAKTHPNHKPLSDEELKQAIREAVAHGAMRNDPINKSAFKRRQRP